MKKILSTVLFIFSIIFMVGAQNATLSVTGHVTDDVTGAPIQNHLVVVSVLGGDTYLDYEFFTNDAGFYGSDSIPGASQGIVRAGTFDCIGEEHAQEDYFYPGNYTFVFDFEICGDSIPSGCQASFFYEPIPGADATIMFFDSSTGNPTNWFWEFGDGTSSDDQNPVHMYNAPGVYPVCLSIWNDDYTCEDTYCEDVFVGDSIVPDCENWFWYETQDNITFAFYSEAYPPAFEYIWDFGDGTTGIGQMATHTYDPNSGEIFPVTLTTYTYDPATGDSCVATSTQEVWVGGSGGDCQAYFEYTIDSVTSGAYIVQFLDASIGEPTMWFWDFGDGEFSEEQNPEHIYYESGGYYVCLTIMDSLNSCFDIYCENIIIGGNNYDCENWFWYDTFDNITFEFYGESFPYPAEAYIWDFGDGETGYGQEVEHTYDPNSGEIFIVTLTTYSIIPGTVDTCTAISMQEVWVGGQGNDCENWFWYDTYDFITFEFFGESYPFPANEYFWDFGDGETGYGQEVEHTYDPNSGEIFIVTLTTYSIIPGTVDTCTAISMQEVWAGGQGNDCENWFWYESYGDFTYDFFGESFPYPADYYEWDFGDSTSGSGQEITHTFDPTQGDEFIVCLTTYAYDPVNDSCIAESCQEIFLGGQMGYELTGSIYLDNEPADFALVGLFGMDEFGSFIFDFTLTQMGMYFFENVPEGDYYIFASLTPQSEYFFEYFPTYYGDALFWFDAELITLGEPNNPYDINMIPIGYYNSGPGNITGTVSFSGGKGPGDNINIVLMDQDENPATYVQSDDNGIFDFENLAFGTYKLKVEMPGVDSEIATVILDEDNQDVNIEFIIMGNTVYLSIENKPYLVSVAGNIFPNPVTDYANMEITMSGKSNITVNVFSQLGQLVYTKNQTLETGKQQITFNTSALPEGLYNVQITGQNGEMLMKKFVKVK